MKKLVLSFLAFVLPITLFSGCAALPTLIVPTTVPTLAPTKLPKESINILVVPFYSSDGTQIHVGDYSDRLRTNDLNELAGLAQEMAQQRDKLTPEQMFVLAIRLYNLGEKDDSVYWFYEAQFRAKLFLKTVDSTRVSRGDPTYELLMDYNSFTESAGKPINGYAGCDVDNWVKIAKVVEDDNPSPPELDKLFPNAILVDRSQWQQINDDVAAGLGGLIDQILQNRDAIKQKRAADNSDARYC
jgi:hypothetical protein